MSIENMYTLNKAAIVLVSEIAKTTGQPRTVPAWVMERYAVLTAELHIIARAASQYLSNTSQVTHPLHCWEVTYQPDGADFVAAAPR